MDVRFDETSIPEDVSKELATTQFALGAIHVSKILKVLVTGVSKLLGDIKNTETPKAVALRRPDGTFIAGAKVKFNRNPDSPDDISAGNWSYTWTFYEKDLDDADVVDMNTSNTVFTYFITAADKLFRMRFNNDAAGIRIFNLIMEGISHWLEDNAKDGDVSTIELPGAITASCKVENGVVVKALVPDGETVKTLIKGDDMYQEM